MKERESLCNILTNFILSDNKIASSIFKKELIDTGKMSNLTIQNILSGKIIVKSLETSALIWIYRAISKHKADMPDISKYFEELEIKKADNEKEKALQSQFPIVLNAVPLLQKDQYLLSMDIKLVNRLQLNGIIEVIENMQRESEITVYNGQLITHVAYNDDKAREISNSMLQRNYWSDAIRFHLIRNEIIDYYYDIENKKIVIKNGNLALLDGQHRVRAMEYALIQEPTLEYDFPVILSIGTIKDGQHIIAQHEKLQPINKNVIKTYQKTVANEIIRKFETNEEIAEIYKFVDTIQKIQVNAGFVLKADIIDAINKYYNVDNYSLKEQSDLVKWLVEFFMEIAYCFENDFKNYIKNDKWSTNHFVFPAYVWLSSYLRNNIEWKKILLELLGKIDFTKKPWRVGTAKPDLVIIKMFKEVLQYENS